MTHISFTSDHHWKRPDSDPERIGLRLSIQTYPTQYKHTPVASYVFLVWEWRNWKKRSKNSGDSSVIGEIPTSLGFFTQSSLILALLRAKELVIEIIDASIFAEYRLYIRRLSQIFPHPGSGVPLRPLCNW